MREKFPVQIKDEVFGGHDSISVFDILAELKRACESSWINEVAAFRTFRIFMSCTALAAIKIWLALSANDSNRHEGTITMYAVLKPYSLCFRVREMRLLREMERVVFKSHDMTYHHGVVRQTNK